MYTTDVEVYWTPLYMPVDLVNSWDQMYGRSYCLFETETNWDKFAPPGSTGMLSASQRNFKNMSQPNQRLFIDLGTWPDTHRNSWHIDRQPWGRRGWERMLVQFFSSSLGVPSPLSDPSLLSFFYPLIFLLVSLTLIVLFISPYHPLLTYPPLFYVLFNHLQIHSVDLLWVGSTARHHNIAVHLGVLSALAACVCMPPC